MKTYVKSNPTFFRLILTSMSICIVLLLILSYLIPAPLQEQGSLSVVPNPVKSAWFLLWIQELVSYDKRLIYAVIMLASAFMALPWLTRYTANHAGWFRKGNRHTCLISLALSIAIVLLTIVALSFRGENWAFISPF